MTPRLAAALKAWADSDGESLSAILELLAAYKAEPAQEGPRFQVGDRVRLTEIEGSETRVLSLEQSYEVEGKYQSKVWNEGVMEPVPDPPKEDEGDG